MSHSRSDCKADEGKFFTEAPEAPGTNSYCTWDWAVPLGFSCNSDANCAAWDKGTKGGVCANHICTLKCDTDSDCATGGRCDNEICKWGE